MVKPVEKSIRFGVAAAVVVLTIFLVLEFPPLRALFRLVDPELEFSSQTSKCSIRVLSYSGFLAEWGPGPELNRLFQENFGCSVQWIDGLDPSRLLDRAELLKADVVVGLDAFSLRTVSAQRLLVPRSQWLKDEIEPSLLDSEVAIALDWSPLGFLSREGEIQPPKDWREFFSKYYDREVTLIDPRLSALGRLMLLHSLKQSKLEPFSLGSALQRLSDGVSPGWSSAYSLFQSGAKAFAAGFLTSRIYHLVSQRDQRVRFWTLGVERPIFVEYAGLLKSASGSSGLNFLRLLRSPAGQKTLLTRNWMFPVREEDLAFDDEEQLRKMNEFRVFLEEIRDSFSQLKRDAAYTEELLKTDSELESKVIKAWMGQ